MFFYYLHLGGSHDPINSRRSQNIVYWRLRKDFIWYRYDINHLASTLAGFATPDIFDDFTTESVPTIRWGHSSVVDLTTQPPLALASCAMTTLCESNKFVLPTGSVSCRREACSMWPQVASRHSGK